jgi:hypothetical protein
MLALRKASPVARRIVAGFPARDGGDLGSLDLSLAALDRSTARATGAPDA